ncbi:MAG: ribonuclease Z [Gammaproteobacteria bacterium]|jgi:ribonuclease Z
MRHYRSILYFQTLGLAFVLALPIIANAGQYSHEDFRFPRENSTTKDGYPTPLSGVPITKTPVIVKKEGVTLKKYPEHYIPGKEHLADDEIRITVLGSGSPTPVRRAQATSGYLVEVGNGDNFIFDMGPGTPANLYSMGVHPALLDKLFLAHLHLDHTGGIFSLFDAMGWARNTPLQVWGPSGSTPELGTAEFTKNVRKAAEWHVQSKRDLLPTGGTEIVAHEIDVSKFSPESPRQLAYDKNGVKIYAFPVIHTIAGSMGYRLEWKGLSFAYTADSEISTFEAEQSKGADVWIHEVFPIPEEYALVTKMPLEHATNALAQHTTPKELGIVFDLAKPGIGIGSHYTLGDAMVDSFFKGVGTTYNGPVMLAHDLSVINVTPEQIVIRQAKTSMLAEVPEPPVLEGVDMNPGKPSDSKRPDWLSKTKIE